MRYSLYIGRWQPFHNGHKYIIDEALRTGQKVLVACRDTGVSESDPYSFELRKRMIEETYPEQVAAGDLKVISIPDIAEIVVGRDVGYEIRDLDVDIPDHIRGISATGIRKAMEARDEAWKRFVPSGTVKVLERSPGLCIWLTGLSGSGKSTIATALADRLERVKILDGDEVRDGICWDLGFTKDDRDTNIRRIAYAAKCICDVGGVALVAAISPYEAAREEARRLVGEHRFRLVHVSTPLEVCEERDVKGLYHMARTGEITAFTGVTDPYEAPTEECLNLDTSKISIEEAVEKVISYVQA